MKDLKLGKAGHLEVVGVVSTSEEERIAKLSEHFRAFLFDYLGKVAQGVRYSPGVNRALIAAFLETAAIAAFSDSRVPDDAIEERSKTFIEEALNLLEAHTRSLLAAAGVETETQA